MSTMGALEEMEEVRPNVPERVGKTRDIGRHLKRIFNTTKALEHTVLTDGDLKELGIKLSTLDLEGDSQRLSTGHFQGQSSR